MKTLNVFLEQDSLTVATANIEIANNKQVNFEKLTKALTQAVFRRVDATKAGIKTGIKVSQPFNLKVTMESRINGELKRENILNLADIAAYSSMEDRIKVNCSILNKDRAKAMKQFNDTVLYVIDAHKEFDEGVVGSVE